jgi:hypothetical protein
LLATGPPRGSIPKTGGRSFSKVPRPPGPGSWRQRPWRPWLCTTSGWPLGPAITYAAAHAPASPRGTGALLYHAVTALGGHLLSSTARQRQCLGQRCSRDLPAHALPTQAPDWQRLRRARKDGGGQSLQAWGTVGTRRALPGRCRGLPAARDGRCGLPRGADAPVGPASWADRRLARSLIKQMRDVALRRWTPVRGENMGAQSVDDGLTFHTLESNKSVGLIPHVSMSKRMGSVDMSTLMIPW